MDLLRAINQILPALGEHPVTSVDAKHPTVSVILQNIQAQMHALLSDGWWFNEYDTTLYPGPEGEIDLPLNVLSVLPARRNCRGIQRGRRLYDMENRTFKWPVGQGVPVVIRENLEFEELPETAASFVLYTALVLSYLTDIGLEQIVNEWKGLAADARNAMEQEHLRYKGYSTRNSPRFRRIERAIKGM